MRALSKKTTFWAYIGMLFLCVIDLLLNIKEAIENGPNWHDLFISIMLIIIFTSFVFSAKNEMKKD